MEENVMIERAERQNMRRASDRGLAVDLRKRFEQVFILGAGVGFLGGMAMGVLIAIVIIIK